MLLELEDAWILKMTCCTCDCEKNTSKLFPPGFLVAFKEAVDVIGVERLEYGGIILANVVEANESDAEKPHANAWSEAVAHLISAKPLKGKHHQNCHRHPNHYIYTHDRYLQ